MGFVSSFFQKLPLKLVGQLPLQTPDFMLQKLLLTHMVFVLQRRKIRSRIVGQSHDNYTSKEGNWELFVRLVHGAGSSVL
ncbi:unnamed protein product [Coffea canephora]|uniref:Uncharacterized protein n=1 Tax=Coffea canephora TaxID=49390 RepID=A0A068VC10_COFCA|nr:unnamed protein product [Coffea canephora]